MQLDSHNCYSLQYAFNDMVEIKAYIRRMLNVLISHFMEVILRWQLLPWLVIMNQLMNQLSFNRLWFTQMKKECCLVISSQYWNFLPFKSRHAKVSRGEEAGNLKAVLALWHYSTIESMAKNLSASILSYDMQKESKPAKGGGWTHSESNGIWCSSILGQSCRLGSRRGLPGFMSLLFESLPKQKPEVQ